MFQNIRKLSFKLPLISLVLLSLLTSNANSQQQPGAQIVNASGAAKSESGALRFSQWQNVGPNGGDVRSIVVDPSNSNHFYFSTLDGQIYTSDNAGQNWRLLYNFNRPQLILDSLMIDSRDSNTLYVAGHRHKEPGGFFKSSDGGKTWREADEFKKLAIYAITQSAKNPDMLLAGTYDGVYASYDSGNSWKKISDEKALPGLVNVESLAIDPRNADVIYAGTWYRPYKTTDGGKNWRLISKGMIDDSDVFAINIDPRNPDHVVASACSGIYDSRDAGENWKKVAGIPSTSRRTRDILQHPSKAGYVYAGTTEGFWMSADGGASWSLTTTKQLEINSITVPADEPNKVYIGTNNYGVMISNDFGKTFQQTNAGYSTRLTYTIVPDVEQPNRFYAATHNTATGGGFFFVSNDEGATWQASMRNFPSRLLVYSILQDAEKPTTVYLGTSNGVYRSLDRGASWAQVTAPKAPMRRAAPKQTATAAAPTTTKKPATAAAKTTASAKTPAKTATAKPNAKVTAKANAKTPAKTPAKPAAQTAKKVETAKSSAPAKQSNRVAALTEKVNYLIPAFGEQKGMFAATDKGLYRTSNIDKGWDKIEFPADLDAQILTAAISPKNPDTIWLGTARSGVLVSRDAGKTWEQIKGITKDYPVSHIEIDPNDSSRVYVGTRQTFYMTKNGGENWDRRGGGLPAGDYNSIAVNPNNSNEIFAASAQENREGLFHSLDAGKSWERVDSGKPNLASRRIWTVSFDPRNPNLLLVGSHSAGIYRVERGLTATANE